ncbi:MAG: hypothetical protein ACFCU2_00390 [Acidimicrobiia bacterium]
MDFSLLSSLIAGFLATVIMTLATELATLRGATSMPSIPLLVGAVVSGDHDLAMAIGSLMHYVVIGTAVNGSIYALVFSLTGAGLNVALLLGMVHGALIGVGLGWLKGVHPRVVDRLAAASGAAFSVDRGEIVFNDPGMFGVGWGDMTPAVVVGAYVVYSLVFALVYSLTV